MVFDGHSFALCPFHNEATPSFLCRQNDHMWKCFGCSASGDLIDFVMRKFNLSFGAALDAIESEFRLSGAVSLADLRAIDQHKMAMGAKKRRAREAERAYLDALEAWLDCESRIKLAGKCDPLGEYMATLRWQEVSARIALQQAEQDRAAVTQAQKEVRNIGRIEQNRRN